MDKPLVMPGPNHGGLPMIGSQIQTPAQKSSRRLIKHLFTIMQEHEAALEMGTTVVGAVLSPSKLLTFNVGDSRC